MNHATKASRGERGVTLLESLVALLIFSIGLLALLAAFARATVVNGDTQYRIEAANHAQAAMQTIWNSVKRNSAGTVILTGDPLALDQFALSAGGSTCGANSLSVSTSARGVMCAWYSRMTADRTGLPRGTGTVAIDTTANAFNRVTINMTWQIPGETVAHRHQVIGYIN